MGWEDKETEKIFEFETYPLAFDGFAIMGRPSIGFCIMKNMVFTSLTRVMSRLGFYISVAHGLRSA